MLLMYCRTMLSVLVLTVLVVLGTAAPACAQGLVRVPQDRDLQGAINSVSDGGVIEIAGGTYPSPANGWQIANTRKGFTVRAAGGAQVVLDGGRSRRILRYENGARNRGKLVTFERLTFRNGMANAGGAGGTVTLTQAEAVFRDCIFEDNAESSSSAYGAVRASNGSDVSFFGCTFRGNHARVRGGAVAVENANAVFQGCTFTGNRVNLPGHDPGSAGGAIYVLASTVHVADSHFEGNEAGWVGGALYAIGLWTAGTTADVQVSRSTFLHNRADFQPCCVAPGPTTGGAIHAEDQTTLTVDGSRFVGNEALIGGGISGYRSVVEVRDSVFQGNRSLGDGELGAGGAVNMLSSDAVDPSTGNGTINRRAARLTITGSLLQGRFGDTAAAAGVSNVGGCLLAGGDASRQYGDGGVPAMGGLADNRAVVVLRNDVFYDCDAERNSAGEGGFGGGIHLDLADLTLEDSMLLRSDAHAKTAGGGALFVSRDSDVKVNRTTFAGNTAENRGGAVDLGGSTIQMTASRFLANEVSPGENEGTNQSLGAALYALPLLSPRDPSRARNVGGVVSGTLFSDNVGVPVFDVDPDAGPINDVRYNGNDFYSPRYPVYVNTLADPGRQGMSVAQLNALVVNRGGRPSTDKSQVDNHQLGVAPRVGDLVAVPPTLPTGAPSSPANAFIAYAWSGRSATLNGQTLPAKNGVLEVAAPGTYTLSVDGTAVDTVQVATTSCTSGPRLCLRSDRFRLDVSWRDGQGRTGSGQAVPLSGDTGYFWFFDPANVELMVKVLDGRALNGNFWVFYGALSDVQYTLTVTDSVTGRVKTYRNPSGRLASVADTGAFPAAGAASAADEAATAESLLLGSIGEAASACGAGATQLCLNSSRFRVEVTWQAQGRSGAGQAVPLTSDTGYFWFFDPANVELVVKILDGRGLNNHFWVFYGALSDVRYTLTITDTQTGRVKTYTNPAGTLASVADTQALPAQ
jgi:hypothetical protein